MIPRKMAATVERLARGFPVVVITGPRQSGKTTLAKACFAAKPYISLEDPDSRAFAQEDPRGFLARFPDGAILDEIQRCPLLFSYLQRVVDERPEPGRYILSGSQQFGMLASIGQSLAGRAGLAQLLPLSQAEIGNPNASLDTALLKGGYPPIHTRDVTTADWFASYVATYLERDVRQVLKVQDLSLFQKFLRLCAARTGQILHLNALAGEVGVSHTTIRAWMSVLEASYVVWLLPPYHKNFGKRLVKSPKLYFLDVGLAAWLMGIRSEEMLQWHPARGALFETWAVTEFLKMRWNRGLPADLYFWRDNNGTEADLVWERGGKLQPVEIKSGMTITSDYLRAGQKAGRFAKQESHTPWLVYGGDEDCERSGVAVKSWKTWAGWAEDF